MSRPPFPLYLAVMVLLAPGPILFPYYSPMGFHNAVGPALGLAFAWLALLVAGCFLYGARALWLLAVSPFALASFMILYG
jgi:hypothetical protein